VGGKFHAISFSFQFWFLLFVWYLGLWNIRNFGFGNWELIPGGRDVNLLRCFGFIVFLDLCFGLLSECFGYCLGCLFLHLIDTSSIFTLVCLHGLDYAGFNLNFAGMRFLPVSKLDQIFRSSFSHLWGRKTGSNVVVEGQRRYKPNTPRHHHHHRRRHHDHCHGRVYFSLVPEIIVAISEAGLWRGFSVTSCQKLIGTASWAGAGAGAGAGVEQRVWQECSVSLLQIWKAWRLNGVYREMRDFSYRKCQSGVYWRPAVFVSLADKKDIVALIGCACGRSSLSPERKTRFGRAASWQLGAD